MGDAFFYQAPENAPGLQLRSISLRLCMHLAICKAAFDDCRTPEDGTGCGGQVGWGPL